MKLNALLKKVLLNSWLKERSKSSLMHRRLPPKLRPERRKLQRLSSKVVSRMLR